MMERAFYNAIKHAHTEAASQQKRKLLDGVALLALPRPVGYIASHDVDRCTRRVVQEAEVAWSAGLPMQMY